MAFLLSLVLLEFIPLYTWLFVYMICGCDTCVLFAWLLKEPGCKKEGKRKINVWSDGESKCRPKWKRHFQMKQRRKKRRRWRKKRKSRPISTMISMAVRWEKKPFCLFCVHVFFLICLHPPAPLSYLVFLSSALHLLSSANVFIRVFLRSLCHSRSLVSSPSDGGGNRSVKKWVDALWKELGTNFREDLTLFFLKLKSLWWGLSGRCWRNPWEWW